MLSKGALSEESCTITTSSQQRDMRFASAHTHRPLLLVHLI